MLGKRADGMGARGTWSHITLAALGTFLLWLGWFGFDPGRSIGGDTFPGG